MNDKVKMTIERHAMIARGGRVFVALSGGADSVALLHVLWSLRGRYGFSLRALHFNHRLRGVESDRDEAFVRGLCGRMAVRLTVGAAPVKKLARLHKLSVEECARKLRYAFFRRHAGSAGDRVATAHTASDNTETLLLNMVRGTGLRGLCGIPPVRGNIIRPLLDCSRSEIEAYCAKHRLRYITDSSNLSDAHLRNRIRHQIVPGLVRENPRLEARVSDMASMLRADADYLDAAAASALDGAVQGDGSWSRDALLGLHQALLPRALRLMLKSKGLRYDRERLRLLHQVLDRGSGAVQLAPEWALRCDGQSVIIAPPAVNKYRIPPVSSQSVQINWESFNGAVHTTLFRGKKLGFYLLDFQKCEESIKYEEKSLKNALDCDRIERILEMRLARPADTFRPVGRGCTKTMKKLWSERKLSLELRRRQTVLAGAGKIIWAEGYGADESCAVDEKTSRALVIQILEDGKDAGGYCTGFD